MCTFILNLVNQKYIHVHVCIYTDVKKKNNADEQCSANHQFSLILFIRRG